MKLWFSSNGYTNPWINIRKDNNDVIYKTRREKYSAVLKTIIEVNKKGQPVL